MYCIWRWSRTKTGVAVGFGVLLAAVILFSCCFHRFGASALDSTEREGIAVPIIMYHGLIQDQKYQTKYFISPDIFASDLEYLKEAGYESIFISDLIDYVENGTPLPEKPILLTFDDGYYNNYLYAYPKAVDQGFKIIISPITRCVEEYSASGERNGYYSILPWELIREMQQSGWVEIQNHTYDMHEISEKRKGCKRNAGETLQQYRNVLLTDVQKAQKRIAEETGFTPQAFVYPFGAISDEALPILKEIGFQATLTCKSKMNYITRDPECLYELGRFIRTNDKSSAQYFESILG